MRLLRAACLAALFLVAPLVTAVPAAAAGNAAPAVAPAYAAKVSFKRGVPLRFPDFELTFTGERHAATPKFPRGFRTHDFRVVRGRGSQMVSWTAGTGDLGPVRFTVGTRVYALELRQSEKLGKLRDDELVVTKVP